METLSEVRAELIAEKEEIAALETEICSLGIEFENLWQKLMDFAERDGLVDAASWKWLNDQSKELTTMAVVTDKNAEEVRLAEEGSNGNFSDELAQMKYRLALHKNLRAQLELHRSHLLDAISRMRPKASGIV